MRAGSVEVVADPAVLDAKVSDLVELALSNLRRTAKLGKKRELDPGVWALDFENDDALEHLLVPELFDAITVDGDTVVFPISLARLLVVGANDIGAIGKALTLASERVDQPGALIDFALVRNGDTWAPFVPEHELAETLSLRALMHLGAAYAAQRKRFPDEPLVDFAVHMHVELSVTRWKDDGRAVWLPWTSVIELDDGSGKPTAANFDDIAAAVPGALEKVPNVWPERYIARRFPPPDVIAKFRRELEVPKPPPRLVPVVTLVAIAFIVYLLVRR